jgi:hypothetical protein
MPGGSLRARPAAFAGAAACAAALVSCSLVLDWSGYTGGDAGDSASAGDAGEDAPRPACDPQTCAGCCEPDGCAAGNQGASCGQGGQLCQNCAGEGLTCSAGQCVKPPDEAGPAPCSLIECKTLLTCLTSIDIACCKPDGSCGCMSVLSNSGCN